MTPRLKKRKVPTLRKVTLMKMKQMKSHWQAKGLQQLKQQAPLPANEADRHTCAPKAGTNGLSLHRSREVGHKFCMSLRLKVMQ
ncbi:hypothetical protein DBV15_02695 [Temnothorax longispinosus]|uniref:Uncharacterized protein n=1 Tax=Temnothorax longispinosus TaxID=300112 RepID=A0A4S2K989_9HYME|nr:hypothetical protein DBV15_02695 [Temnothorax longispinosus]